MSGFTLTAEHLKKNNQLLSSQSRDSQHSDQQEAEKQHQNRMSSLTPSRVIQELRETRSNNNNNSKNDDDDDDDDDERDHHRRHRQEKKNTKNKPSTAPSPSSHQQEREQQQVRSPPATPPTASKKKDSPPQEQQSQGKKIVTNKKDEKMISFENTDGAHHTTPKANVGNNNHQKDDGSIQRQQQHQQQQKQQNGLTVDNDDIDDEDESDNSFHHSNMNDELDHFDDNNNNNDDDEDYDNDGDGGVAAGGDSRSMISGGGGSSHNSSSHNDKVSQLRRVLRLIPSKDRDDLLMKDVDQQHQSAAASTSKNTGESPLEKSGNMNGSTATEKMGASSTTRNHDPNNFASLADDLEACASDEEKTMRFFEELTDNPFVATLVIEAQTQTIIWVNEFATFLFNLVESDLVGQDVSILMGPVPGRDNKAFHHKKISSFLHKWASNRAMPDTKIASGRVQELVACRFEGIKRIPFTAQLCIRPVRMSLRDEHSPPVAFVGFFRDYSPDKALKVSLALNRYNIANCSESIIVLNTRGQIKEMNEAAAELFGYDQDFLVQTEANVKLLMPESTAKEHDRYLRAFREKLSTPGFDIRTSPIISKERVLTARRVDGTEFPIQLRVELHIDQTRSGNDRLIGYIQDRRALIKAKDFNLEVSKRLFPESIAKIISQKQEMSSVEHYRNMPVILIDMVGFTSLTRNLDNESVFELVNNMYKVLAQIAQCYQVEVAKCTGDGVIAVCGLDEFDDRKTRMDRAISFALSALRWSQENNRPLRIGVGYGELGSGVMHCAPNKQRPSWDIWGQAVTESSFLENKADPNTVHTTQAGYRALVDPELQSLFKPKTHPDGPPKGMVMRVNEKRFITYQTEGQLNHAETFDITEKVKNTAMSRIYLKKENARELKEQQERRALTQA